jgi:hypothetical protein
VHFLSWGDYVIPFDWATYWAKHFYMWSFQSGTPNPDGVIRLPGRALNFLVFGATDNVGLGYFYIFSSLVVAFIAFFFFARKFLKIERTSVQIIGALFFACNPIFLGNVAKIGLVLAVSMLPLCLLAVRAAFIQKRFRYLLLYIICLNLSFLHPYTFTVNLAVSGVYFLWMAWKNRAWVFDTWPKFVAIGLFGIALNLYFALPLLAMGTVSKDVISTSITPVAVDYTALVGISNTGDLFTGFSLSKNVFVDFAFYNSTYQNVYFFGVFLFYVILFGLYLYTEKQLKLDEKRRVGILFGCFLVLLLLAATTVAHVDSLIKFLIGLPGGWAFRSPLKWQLYIPLVLFGLLVVLLNRVSGRLRVWGFKAALLLTFVLMNAYLATDIFYKILSPQKPTYFAALANQNLNGKTVLFVNNGECMDFMRTYPRITSELNQIFGSKNTQLKHVLEDSIDSVNLASYDYVLGCNDRSGSLLTSTFNFVQTGRFVNDTFRLYANQKPTAAIAATDSMYYLSSNQLLGNAYAFATSQLSDSFSVVPDAKHPATTLSDLFSRLSPRDVSDGAIVGQAVGSQIRTLANDGVYYQLNGTNLTLSTSPGPGLQPIQQGTIELSPTTTYNVTYQDASLKPTNLVPNGSLEQGLWQGAVGDCYAYNNKPIIGMRLSTADKTAGNQALELSARSHIACTGPADSIPVSQRTHLLLSFDYQSPDGGKYAGYYASFNDPNETVISQRMEGQGTSWQNFSKELSVPSGATSMRLQLYAFPDSYGERSHIARYDQINLTPIPPIQNRFYVISPPKIRLQKPRGLSYDNKNPTRKLVQITGASQPFYLTTNESYHALWQAEVVGKRPKIQLPFATRQSVDSADHLPLNGTMNAWYINPTQLCGQGNGCIKHADGSYDFTLALEFTPQRWFYFGGSLSIAALLAGCAYFLYDRRSGEKHKEGRWRWHK